MVHHFHLLLLLLLLGEVLHHAGQILLVGGGGGVADVRGQIVVVVPHDVILGGVVGLVINTVTTTPGEAIKIL